MDIIKTYQLPYSIDEVYNAWVSSDTVIPPATAMDIIPEVGGHYRLIIESSELTSNNEGEFLIVEPKSHVRYTWEWNNDGEVTEIDVKFGSTNNGTQIVLTHTGFHNQSSRDMHSAGWESYIKGLIAHLSNS